MADSIPIEYAMKEGCEKVIVVLTRDETYKKSKQKFIPIIKLLYKKYPNLIKAIENRHNNYNNSLSIVNDLCKKLYRTIKDETKYSLIFY